MNNGLERIDKKTNIT